MSRIAPISTESISKPDKLAERMAQFNHKVYDGKFNPIELEEWIKVTEKIFDVIQVLMEKTVNTRTHYLGGEVDILWSMVKDN